MFHFYVKSNKYGVQSINLQFIGYITERYYTGRIYFKIAHLFLPLHLDR